MTNVQFIMNQPGANSMKTFFLLNGHDTNASEAVAFAAANPFLPVGPANQILAAIHDSASAHLDFSCRGRVDHDEHFSFRSTDRFVRSAFGRTELEDFPGRNALARDRLWFSDRALFPRLSVTRRSGTFVYRKIDSPCRLDGAVHRSYSRRYSTDHGPTQRRFPSPAPIRSY